MPRLPYWQLPEFSRNRRVEEPPTWRVVFLLPLEDIELDLFMRRLVVIDNLENWPDRPDAEPRRLLDVPWPIDFTPDSSIISAMFKRGGEEPLIFIDEQSRIDDTAILLYRTEGQDDHRILRAPINRANLLLSAAAEGTANLEGEDFQPLGYDIPAIMVSIHDAKFRLESNLELETRRARYGRTIPCVCHRSHDCRRIRKTQELCRGETG
jgi:hypothetical protein